jgi:hypothetical protein
VFNYYIKFIVRRKSYWMAGTLKDLKHLSKWLTEQEITHSIWKRYKPDAIHWFKRKSKVV